MVWSHARPPCCLQRKGKHLSCSLTLTAAWCKAPQRFRYLQHGKCIYIYKYVITHTYIVICIYIYIYIYPAPSGPQKGWLAISNCYPARQTLLTSAELLPQPFLLSFLFNYKLWIRQSSLLVPLFGPQPPLRIFHNHLLAKSIQGNQPRGSDKWEPSKGPKGLNLLKLLHHSKSDFTIQQFHSYFCLQRPSCIRQERAEKVFNCVGCAYWEHQATKQFSSLFNICQAAV